MVDVNVGIGNNYLYVKYNFDGYSSERKIPLSEGELDNALMKAATGLRGRALPNINFQPLEDIVLGIKGIEEAAISILDNSSR